MNVDAITPPGPRLIVLTGGPGAGKTAALEVIRRHFAGRVDVLPEAASIVFGGGFPRRDGPAARRAAQRAIFRVEEQLERLACETTRARLVLCDRGTLDGLAYWPAGGGDLLADMGTTLPVELRRYAMVVDLRPPSATQGFNHQNPLRTESPTEAVEIDERIAAAWSGHPRRVFVASADHFLHKVAQVIQLIHAELADGGSGGTPSALSGTEETP